MSEELDALRREVAELREVVGLLLEQQHAVNVALAKPGKDWQYGRMESVWQKYLAEKRQKMEAGNLGAG